MKRISELVLLSLTFALPVQAASFDCAKARTNVEHLICGNTELSELDDVLAAKYSSALKNHAKSEAIRKSQRLWLKARNGCSDAVCIKHAYKARLSIFDSPSLNIQPTPKRPPFSLLKGKGVAVCDAYLKRLNKTEWGYHEKLPTCGRPENNNVEGFEKLGRVPLTTQQVSILYNEIFSFSSRDKQAGNSKLIKDAKELIDNHSIVAWRYAPSVDIDNDGKPDTGLVVWQGYGLVGGVGGARCGTSWGESNRLQIQPTEIFIVNWAQMKLNDKRTRKFFGHPLGGYPRTQDGKLIGGFYNGFRPIGLEMGIFEYRSQYYFDTFFDGWGDFEGKRRSDWGDGKPRIKNNLMDILGVFQRKDGITKQICEYRWNDFNKYYR